MIGEPEPETSKSMPASYYLYVEDVYQTLEKAIAHGATELFAATDMPYQDRQAGITDPAAMRGGFREGSSKSPTIVNDRF